MCLQQTVPNQDFDRIISLQQCDERLCSMQWVSFGVFAHLEVIWLDLEKDYQDFAAFCVATRENHLRHICLQIVRLCLTLRTVLNEQNWLQLKKKKNYTKMSNYRKLCHKKNWNLKSITKRTFLPIMQCSPWRSQALPLNYWLYFLFLADIISNKINKLKKMFNCYENNNCNFNVVLNQFKV